MALGCRDSFDVFYTTVVGLSIFEVSACREVSGGNDLSTRASWLQAAVPCTESTTMVVLERVDELEKREARKEGEQVV